MYRTWRAHARKGEIPEFVLVGLKYGRYAFFLAFILLRLAWPSVVVAAVPSTLVPVTEFGAKGSDDASPQLLADARPRLPIKAPWISGSVSRRQCVPYARELSGIDIRGDAWTWWASAKGRYQRGRKPAAKAVLVFKRKGGGLGHLAVVTHIINDRIVVASHTNWLNKGQVHHNTPILDVSPHNDWSSVRVWYVPGHHYGGRNYPTYGFIYSPVSAVNR